MELMLSTLRHVDGVPLSKLQAMGFYLRGPKLSHHIENGLLIEETDGLRVAGRGWKLIDSLLVDLEESLSPQIPGPSPDYG